MNGPPVVAFSEQARAWNESARSGILREIGEVALHCRRQVPVRCAHGYLFADWAGMRKGGVGIGFLREDQIAGFLDRRTARADTQVRPYKNETLSHRSRLTPHRRNCGLTPLSCRQSLILQEELDPEGGSVFPPSTSRRASRGVHPTRKDGGVSPFSSRNSTLYPSAKNARPPSAG